jgi:trk system potassium uptake protein
VIRSKLHVLAYSFFIPLFFVSVGLGFDSAVLYGSESRLVILSIVGIVLVSKCLSGFGLIKSEGGSMYEAGLFGASIMAHLSTPLVIAYAGVELGIFDETLKTALVFLTIASALVVPIIVEYFAHRVIDQYAKDTTC